MLFPIVNQNVRMCSHHLQTAKSTFVWLTAPMTTSTCLSIGGTTQTGLHPNPRYISMYLFEKETRFDTESEFYLATIPGASKMTTLLVILSRLLPKVRGCQIARTNRARPLECQCPLAPGSAYIQRNHEWRRLWRGLSIYTILPIAYYLPAMRGSFTFLCISF